MVLWFAGMSVLLVWVVFRDPAIDYRLVVVGALLPDLIDGVTGGAWAAHSVLFPVLVLVVIMAATHRRRRLRRQLLAVPIGLFLHLVLDGAWSDAEVFWWPLFGASVGEYPIPSIERGWLNVPLELIGLVALLWCWFRFGLTDAGRRRTFWRTGHLDRTLVGFGRPGIPKPPSC